MSIIYTTILKKSNDVKTEGYVRNLQAKLWFKNLIKFWNKYNIFIGLFICPFSFSCKRCIGDIHCGCMCIFARCYNSRFYSVVRLKKNRPFLTEVNNIHTKSLVLDFLYNFVSHIWMLQLIMKWNKKWFFKWSLFHIVTISNLLNLNCRVSNYNFISKCKYQFEDKTQLIHIIRQTLKRNKLTIQYSWSRWSNV